MLFLSSTRGGGAGLQPAQLEARARAGSGQLLRAGNSPARPPGYCVSPMWISPRRNVPVVTITARAAIFDAVLRVTTPVTPAVIDVSNPLDHRLLAASTAAGLSSSRRIAAGRALVRLRAEGLHGGAFAGVEHADMGVGRVGVEGHLPPRASISRTRCPLAGPPMLQLHGISEIASRLSVSRRTSRPSRQPQARLRARVARADDDDVEIEHNVTIIARGRASTSYPTSGF